MVSAYWLSHTNSFLSIFVVTAIRKTQPIFSRQLQDSTATDGKPFSLECSLSSGQDAFISWYKNGKILRGVDFKQTYKDGVARLDIREIYPEDAGRYECVAKNAIGESKAYCNVKVVGK